MYYFILTLYGTLFALNAGPTFHFSTSLSDIFYVPTSCNMPTVLFFSIFSHVIVLGDINISHKVIDSCDPGDHEVRVTLDVHVCQIVVSSLYSVYL